ncbi:MAG: signal peptide peptidase SppA [Candidatus Aminicenantes bacterium]|nr:signal peptide peptidase SppA [Candidatus Aminicenantes bacterium]
MKRSRYVLIIVLVFLVLGVVTVASFLLSSLSRSPSVPARAYLDIPLAGEIVEWASPTWIDALILGRTPLSVHDIWWNLRKARGDRRVRSVLLRLNLLLCDWAKVNEIREAVIDFRRSGKQVYAYIEEAPDFDKEYFLATACDRIILHPLGWLGVNGLGGSAPFLKGTLDKLGIQAEVEHVEEFKTAYNMFTEKGYTPSHRLMMESILGDLFETYVGTVAEAREKSEEEVRAWIDKGFFHADEALRAGLVDDLMFEDEALRLVAEASGADRRIRHEDYARIKPESLGLNRGRKVALIYAMGTILGGESLNDGMIGSRTLGRRLRRAREDQNTAAVILRVDSPGGSAVASDSIWREVALTKKVKPVVVSMSDVAGSGGYWISMGAHRIVAQPQTLTGSIGVLFGKFNLKGLYETLGVRSERIVFGKHADLFSSFRSFTLEERAAVKKQILWIYDRFLTKAAEGRDTTKEDVDRIGRGRVWTGRQAHGLGLVDEMGGLSRAIELAKELAGISAYQDVRLDVWPRKTSVWGSLFGRREAVMKTAPGPRFFKALSELEALLPGDRVLSLMPPIPSFR